MILAAPSGGATDGFITPDDLEDLLPFLSEAAIISLIEEYGGTGSSLPVGFMGISLESSPWDGWYFLNGQDVDESEAIGEWALAIGMESNGDGTVPLPDMRDVFPLGSSSSHALMSTGGAASHEISIDEMPSHRHVIDEVYDDGVSPLDENGIFNTVQRVSNPTEGHVHATGGGEAMSLMPPYFAVNFVVFGG